MYFSFQNEISDSLWDSISKNYESQNYQAAILDAIFHLLKIIRDRTDLDLDGVALIGKSFGGSDPILKVNSMRTESEKNEQKGVESMLRGLYQGIRNPRAHEKVDDNKSTCDSLIVFIDFLLKLVEGSKTQFDIGEFCSRVFDPEFVKTEEYSNLLIDQIPENKIFDVILSIINQRNKLKSNTFYFLIKAFQRKISNEQNKELSIIASEILQKTTEDQDIRLFTSGFQKEDWEKIELTARLRTENKLLKSFEDGTFDLPNNQCGSGSLGTWLTNIVTNMEMKDKFDYILAKKLSSDDFEELEYLFKYFRNQILAYKKEPNASVISAIKKGLNRGDQRFYDLVEFSVDMKIEWTNQIKEAYENFKEIDLNPDIEDNIPF